MSYRATQKHKKTVVRVGSRTKMWQCPNPLCLQSLINNNLSNLFVNDLKIVSRSHIYVCAYITFRRGKKKVETHTQKRLSGKK